MPEGPEIKRAADKIAKAIVRQPVTGLFFAFEQLKPYEQIFQGREVLAVQPRGKALLTRFDNQLSIYSHNQLYGLWLIRKLHDYPQTNRQLRLAIHTEKKSALLYSASDIEVLDDVAIAFHPFLSKLGLDLLDEATSLEQVMARFQDRAFQRRRLVGLLLDQHFLCGLGNYLRSEVLFVAKVHPSYRPVDCSPTQVEALAKAAIALPRQSYLSNGITNNLQLAQQLKAEGKRRRDYRHYVFGRQGQPCYLCGATILREELGGRRCYYCPICQMEGRS
ncbi:MAG: endonuclease VIII [Oscillatoriophycideae cyanobacterium NC_groundwater_1537_Pr4_S-0.65um_50_18]|nr:endonuclease VIII [Oscillatoriophycideae cyanobacterium NC_groundwater_1537_Pr4_S-0.65um_50_18]